MLEAGVDVQCHRRADRQVEVAGEGVGQAGFAEGQAAVEHQPAAPQGQPSGEPGVGSEFWFELPPAERPDGASRADLPLIEALATLSYDGRRAEFFQGQLLGALKILQALMEASPAVVTRQDLETRVWGEELPDSDSLRVHIHGLRAVVDKPFDTPYIQTRHGIGYRIAAPDGNG